MMSPTQTQHDVFSNPDARNRGAFPLVALLQADMVGGERRIVAPLARRIGSYATLRSKAVPMVSLEGTDLMLVLPLIGTVSASRLRNVVGSVAASRPDITRALDWLLFGV